MHYNPHEPLVVGNEWVPIDSGQFQPDITTERGTTFHLDTAVTVISGGVYVPVQDPMWHVRANLLAMHVYPRGLENDTGPIEQRIYPVTGGTITGDWAIAGACSTIAQALSGDSNCTVTSTMDDPGTDSGDLDMNFSINANGELNGKRILKLELLYSMGISDIPGFESETYPGNWQFKSQPRSWVITPGIDTGDFADPNYGILDLGEWNWDYPEDRDGIIAGEASWWPWIPSQLQRFDATTPLASRMNIRYSLGEKKVILSWVNMRVTYCEERRVATGGVYLRSSNTPGTKLVPLRPASTLVSGTGVPLTIGEYTVTANALDTGAIETVEQPHGNVRIAYARQLYEILDHQGVKLRKTLVPGERFVSEVTNELPQLSLYTASAAVTGVHGYGAQLPAKVYDSFLAATDIANPVVTNLSTPVQMTQVRFYARKSPETSKSLVLNPNGSSTPFALITPEEHDALPEIWNGWKEVTVRLSAAVPFQVTGGAQVWNWSSTGEDIGRAWEVLGVTADTAFPNSPPSTGALTNTGQTYGKGLVRFWHGFWDSWADSGLIFSGDPAVPTGFAVAELEQAVVGIDPTCPGVNVDCIPTSIRYHNLTWQRTGLIDTFERTETNTWGTANSGQVWDNEAGTQADYDVSGGYGTVALPTADTSHFIVGTDTSYNVDFRATLRINQNPTGAAIRLGAIFRYIDTNNYYEVRVVVNTDNTAQLGIFKVVSGTAAFIGGTSDFTVPGMSFFANEDYELHVQTQGQVIYASLWRPLRQSEPLNWTLTAVDNTPAWSGRSGFRMRSAPSNTNVGLIVSVGSVTIDDLDSGGYEIQRQDDVDTDWQTIMRTQSSLTGSFADYEARVGVSSRYRLRKANFLDFWSDWTATQAHTLSAPGVDVAGDGNSVLIFTTNFVQDGGSNLAFTMTWARDPQEAFGFIEAGEVNFSKMYGRNFQLAAHPTERGGEQFTRSVIVQQGAIPAPSLGNFRDLRDMAWNAAPYICVRDELGNRWLANVAVPDGVVSRNRRLYVASLVITEVTATAAIIDPEE